MRCAYPSRRGAVARAQHAAGGHRRRILPTPTSTSVPTIERTICWQNAVARDVEAQHAVAEVVPARRRAPAAPWSSRRGPLRQNEEKSCSPRNGSAASRSSPRSSGSGTPPGGAGQERDRARAGSGSCSGSARQRAERRASKSRVDQRRRRARRPRGRSWRVDRVRRRARGRCRRRRRPGPTPPGPSACTPASVRPAQVSSTGRRRSTRSSASRSTPADGALRRAARRSRGSRCRRSATGELERTGDPPEPASGSSKSVRARVQTSSMRAMGALSPWRGPSLRMRSVAAVAVARSAGRSRRTACAPCPCRGGTRPPGGCWCTPPFLALVMSFSATGRRALALASVVTMPSAAISDATGWPSSAAGGRRRRRSGGPSSGWPAWRLLLRRAATRPRSSSFWMTSSSDFWPKLVMARRSSSVFCTSSPMVLTWARLRQLRGRSDRSRSSIGRSRSGEPRSTAADLAELEALGLVAHVGDERHEVAQRGAGRGERLARRDRTVGLDVEDEPVVVGGLLDAGGLDRERHPAHRREDRVDRDDADGRRALVALGRHVAAALLDGEVDGEAALGVERGDVQVGVEDLDVGGGLDVAGGDVARAAHVEAQGDRLVGRARAARGP